MKRRIALGIILVVVTGCELTPDPTTTISPPTVSQQAAEARAESAVAAWHPNVDTRPFVWAYAAECPRGQPAETGHRFICSVVITGHVAGAPDTGALGYPAAVEVVIEVINSDGQVLGEVIDQ